MYIFFDIFIYLNLNEIKLEIEYNDMNNTLLLTFYKLEIVNE